jgi:2'-5' RNA ligase
MVFTFYRVLHQPHQVIEFFINSARIPAFLGSCKMRTFVAVKIHVKPVLEDVIRTLQGTLRGERIKWVDIRNLHLTLFFLGETPDKHIDPITAGLKGVVDKLESFSIILSGMGLFRNIRDPRVIWIGIEDSPALLELQSGIADFLVGLGYRKETRPFSPHLTIGRPKSIHDRQPLMEEMEKNKNRFMQESIVQDVVFYESILKERGPEYRIIETFLLNRNTLI